ncbi:YlxR family protein [Thermosulfurimonas sp. F29]|uniref:YlxR family protein n=1 Tax=Thermosulfurimonas sp. F29 TaxID=2867247 RepID=UPI001C82B6C2|nr:YlxR family protein [Thermosulfurimonas sp. F29]MBX6422766.1 YlxR family protein [Thermosulfurimonas sp. F29]
MGRKGHVPIRMCVFCGRRAPKGELLRLVLDGEGRPVYDAAQRLPGRGAYLCGEERCLSKLATPKGQRRLGRAFRGRMRGFSPTLIQVLLGARGGRKNDEQDSDL